MRTGWNVASRIPLFLRLTTPVTTTVSGSENRTGAAINPSPVRSWPVNAIGANCGNLLLTPCSRHLFLVQMIHFSPSYSLARRCCPFWQAQHPLRGLDETKARLEEGQEFDSCGQVLLRRKGVSDEPGKENKININNNHHRLISSLFRLMLCQYSA